MNFIFTQQESTEITRSVKQAHEYAAVIIRHNRDIPLGATVPVYPAGTYDSSNNTPVYTLAEFSTVVNNIVRRHS